MKNFLAVFLVLLSIDCVGQSQDLQFDYYMKEAQNARKNGDYKLACQLSTHASELATYFMRGSVQEEQAIRFNRETCKVVADKEKVEKLERDAADKKYIEESRRNFKALCRRLYPAYRAALDQCAIATNLQRCLEIKLGNESQWAQLQYCER